VEEALQELELEMLTEVLVVVKTTLALQQEVKVFKQLHLLFLLIVKHTDLEIMEVLLHM
jgi:hypothetical protein